MRDAARLAVCAAVILCGTARAEDLPAASRRVADSLSALLTASGEAATVKSVALLPFAEGPGVTPGQGKAAAEAVAARLTQGGKVKVMDPSAVKAALGEQRLQAMLGSGKVDEAELARGSGAQAAVSGQLSADGDRIKISVKLAALPSGKAIGSAQAMAEAPPRAAQATSIEVAMRRLSDGLAAGFSGIPGGARYGRLAVLTFGEVGERAAKKKLGTIVTAEIATNLRRDHGLLLVERARLGEVMGELKLQAMASPDAAQASRIGQLADAQALVIGSVAEAGDRYLVTARIVATQSGVTLAAESVTVPEASLAAIASDAVVLRSRGDAAFRSLLVPGLGQFYNRQPAKGWAFAGTEAVLLGGALAFHLSGTKAYDDYKAFSGGGGAPSAEATRLYDQASSRFRTRNWLLVGAGAVWAVNLVDAWISGVDGETMLGGGVAAGPVPLEGGAGFAVAGRF